MMQDFGDQIDLPEATVLGKNVKAPTLYEPSILVAVPRSANRDKYGISNEMFSGFDWWNCYECSALDLQGVPFYFSMSIRYPSNSPNIVESKSLKLYLNSFNMAKVGNIRDFEKLVINDLNRLLGVDEVTISQISKIEQFDEFKSLNQACDAGLIHISNLFYTENEGTLRGYNVNDGRSVWKFEGFRSNCKITGAPDFATVYINLRGNWQPLPESLLRYLISYRNEAHFHEECCELIFKRLQENFNPKYLSVRCNYTRRGGIDITPMRETFQHKVDYSYSGYVTRTEYQ